MRNFSICMFLCLSIVCPAQDTFSIVAIDSVTGAIGSAGASCVPITLPFAPKGALIISDIIPGTGAIHTQAYWLAANQQNARARMLAGDSAQQIISWLTQNDAQSNSSIRQYGIVDYNAGHPRSAAFTGAGCNDYKNHITGPGYSIQGNILLGQQILDSMESRYLNTPGSMADKLMAALQGANVIGADTRCAPYGLSSLSSFLRVALPTDSAGNFHLDLAMAYPSNTSYPVDPIDSLQTLYNNWIAGIHEQSNPELQVAIYYAGEEVIVETDGPLKNSPLNLELTDVTGKKVLTVPFSNQIKLNRKQLKLAAQTYVYTIRNQNNICATGKLIF